MAEHIVIKTPDKRPARIVKIYEWSYRVLPQTRDVTKRLNDLGDFDTNDDEAVEKGIAGVDVRLEPVDGAPPAGEMLVDKWKSNELDIEMLSDIADALRRPASPPR